MRVTKNSFKLMEKVMGAALCCVHGKTKHNEDYEKEKYSFSMFRMCMFYSNALVLWGITRQYEHNQGR